MRNLQLKKPWPSEVYASGCLTGEGRITAVSAKKQRELARAIKRARLLGLLPFVIS